MKEQRFSSYSADWQNLSVGLTVFVYNNEIYRGISHDFSYILTFMQYWNIT